MKNRILVYTVLLFSLALQLFALRYLRVFPDLALMMAVFAGIFLGSFEGVAVGLAAGFLRGCFSSGTAGLDMGTFAVVAYASSVFSSMFYKRNLLFDMISVLAAAIFIFSAQALYFSVLYGVDVYVMSVLKESLRQILFTVLAVPFIFPVWCAFLKVEE